MRKMTVALALAFVANAEAVIPDSGWYFNQSESGRGFNIEIQNSTLFMAGFIYDDNGKQIWVVSGGSMSSDRTYSGDAFLTTDGQRFNGTYRAATFIPFGKAQITWSDTANATIILNGRTFNVSRELFGFDFSSPTQPLLGELSFVEGTTSFFGDRIILTGTQVINGEVWAVGHKTGDTARPALGHYFPSLSQFAILLDSSTLYYDFYTFTFEGVNFVEGLDFTYLKTSTPSTSLPMVGYRTKSAQRVLGQNAPGSEKTVARDETLQTKAAMRAGPAASQAQIEHARAMEDVLRLLQ